MKAAVLLLPALLALAPAAHAAAPPGNSSGHVSVRYQGNLRDALEKIAGEANINLVAVGNLDIPAQVVLHDVTPEQALDTIARAYHLTINKDGNIWTIAAPGVLAPPPPAAPQIAPQAPPPNAPALAPPAPQAKVSEDDDDKDEDSNKDQDDDQEQAAPNAQVTPPGMPALPMPPRPPRFSPGAGLPTGPQFVAEDQTVDSVVSYGGPVKVDGHVTGDAVSFGGNVELGPKARVDGDVVSFGGNVFRDEGAQVGGEVMNFGGNGMGSVVARGITKGFTHGMVLHPPQIERHHEGMSRLASMLLQFVLYFGVGFLILMFAPEAMKKVELEIGRDPLRSGVTGVVAMLAMVVLTPLLVITVVGVIPLIPLWFAAVLAVMMGFTAVAHEIGMRIPAFRGRKTQALVLALGVLILIAVEVIPVVGPITLTLLAFLGLGAVVRTRFGTRPKGFPEPA
jgi:hypothetical protein